MSGQPTVDPVDLLAAALVDARMQLALARLQSRLFRLRTADRNRALEDADIKWRAKWPGLAALIDANPETPMSRGPGRTQAVDGGPPTNQKDTQ